MRSARTIPTSRAYWDLQAEKLMNRIFDPVQAIDLQVDPASAEAIPPAVASAGDPERRPRWRRARRPQPSPIAENELSREPSEADPARPSRQRVLPELAAGIPRPLLLISLLAGAGLLTSAAAMVTMGQWNRAQDSLQQERSLLLVERLRNFGPAAAVPATPPAPVLTPPGSPISPTSTPSEPSGPQAKPTAISKADADPPPPPQEAWIDQLGDLPQPQRRPPAPLRVPLTSKLNAAALPAKPAPPPPAGPMPMLVGVVAAQGRGGSAIFQMGGATTTVSVGEMIGSSGWRLRANESDGVLIEHNGDVRRISIAGGG